MREIGKPLPLRGITYWYHGSEIGSITIRPERLAFIAGNWCNQVPRRSSTLEVLVVAREHQRRLELLIGKLQADERQKPALTPEIRKEQRKYGER